LATFFLATFFLEAFFLEAFFLEAFFLEAFFLEAFFLGSCQAASPRIPYAATSTSRPWLPFANCLGR
jgi:hypothetical protein